MDLKLNFEQFLKDIDISDEMEFLGCNNHFCDGEKHGVHNELCVGIEEEKKLIKKRKKECFLPLLNWLKTVAKNPCDLAIERVPESYKWKDYGSELFWKQILMAKETMSLKDNVVLNGKQSVWKKKQKMHPDMYNEQSKKSYTRCSQRLITLEENRSIQLTTKLQVLNYAESSSSGSDVEDKDTLWAISYKKKRVPLGRAFQAEIPEWTGKTQESETRWLGTHVWPLKETEHTISLCEREPVGKGRQGWCRCQLICSPECVRLHVARKRAWLKLELGPAFAKWKFDMMGEEVSHKWTKREEKEFAGIIKSNPQSSGRRFWDVLVSHFKNKPKHVLLSYYFSVYLLRRRAHQNRVDPSNVDSDDDELEKVGHEINKAKESIFCSPNVHLKFTSAF